MSGDKPNIDTQDMDIRSRMRVLKEGKTEKPKKKPKTNRRLHFGNGYGPGDKAGADRCRKNVIAAIDEQVGMA